MQGISDESFIKNTQSKGKQLNKLISYPYTNNYLGKCNLCMHGPNIRQIEAVMQPLYPLVS